MTHDIKDMTQFLPPTVRIAKTPLFSSDRYPMEVVELNTRDVVDAFMGMQRMATQEALKIRDAGRRAQAVKAIEAMTYFGVGTPTKD
jgi:hypothetical protein